MSTKFKQIMLNEKDIKLIHKIADFLEKEEGDRPKKAAVVRKALHFYMKHNIPRKD